MGNEVMAAQHPHGNLNCGLAHGIPGPLATMSLALACDVTVPGLPEAVDRAAGWLAGHRADDYWGVNWPVAVSLIAVGSVVAAEPGRAGEPSRSAWCYGAPGVARALWLAGCTSRSAGCWSGPPSFPSRHIFASARTPFRRTSRAASSETRRAPSGKTRSTPSGGTRRRGRAAARRRPVRRAA